MPGRGKESKAVFQYCHHIHASHLSLLLSFHIHLPTSSPTSCPPFFTHTIDADYIHVCRTILGGWLIYIETIYLKGNWLSLPLSSSPINWPANGGSLWVPPPSALGCWWQGSCTGSGRCSEFSAAVLSHSPCQGDDITWKLPRNQKEMHNKVKRIHWLVKGDK